MLPRQTNKTLQLTPSDMGFVILLIPPPLYNSLTMSTMSRQLLVQGSSVEV